MSMRRSLLTILAACFLLCAGGCQGFPYLMTVLAPPEKIEAEHDLDADGKLLLLVVDSPQIEEIDTSAVHRHMTRQMSAILLANEAVGGVVSYDELLDLRIANPRQFEEWDPEQIGRELGADQILQIEIKKFALKDDAINPMWHGQMEAMVTVIDLDGKTVWPDDRLHGFPMEPVEIRTNKEATPAYSEKLKQLLSLAMADSVSKLFYDHEVDAYQHNKDKRMEDLKSQGLFID